MKNYYPHIDNKTVQTFHSIRNMIYEFDEHIDLPFDFETFESQYELEQKFYRKFENLLKNSPFFIYR